MNGDPDGLDEQGTGNDAEESGGPETLIDVLTGADVRATPKNRLVQPVLRQLIETYGFDREDIRTDYHPTTKGKRQQQVGSSSCGAARRQSTSGHGRPRANGPRTSCGKAAQPRLPRTLKIWRRHLDSATST